jgi:hypothetical protein
VNPVIEPLLEIATLRAFLQRLILDDKLSGSCSSCWRELLLESDQLIVHLIFSVNKIEVTSSNYIANI